MTDTAKQRVLRLYPDAGVVHDEAYGEGAWFITEDAQTVLGKGETEKEAWEDAERNLYERK